MGIYQRVVMGIAVASIAWIASESRVFARGEAPAPPPTPTLEQRLASAVKALADAHPTPVDATKVKGSKSNTSERVAALLERPVPLATTVKGSKSNSSDRESGIRATATYAKTTDNASPILLRVAKGEIDEAPVGTLATDRDLLLPAGTGILLPAGTYTVGLFDASHHVEPQARAIVTVRGWDPQKKLVGAVLVDADALARQLTTPPEPLPSAESYANAVILNFVVAQLQEPPDFGAAILAAVTSLTGSKPTPVEAINLNSSKSGVYKTAGAAAKPVPVATKVKGSKSNSSERESGIVAASSGERWAWSTFAMNGGEAAIGTLTTKRALVLPTKAPVRLEPGTYRVALWSEAHLKEPHGELVVAITAPDGTTLGGILVGPLAVAPVSGPPAGMDVYGDVWFPAVVLNFLVSMLEEPAAVR